jgi:hypothetical protein
MSSTPRSSRSRRTFLKQAGAVAAAAALPSRRSAASHSEAKETGAPAQTAVKSRAPGRIAGRFDGASFCD